MDFLRSLTGNYIITADHPSDACCLRENPHRFQPRRFRQIRRCCRFKCQRQQSIPSEQSIGLPECLVAGGLSAPEIVVIHTGSGKAD